jgi:hypothetical protein
MVPGGRFHQPQSPHHNEKAGRHAIPHFHVFCLGFLHLGGLSFALLPVLLLIHVSLSLLKGLLTLALHHVFLNASGCFSLCLSEAIYPTSSTALPHDKETAMAAAKSVPL